MRKWIIMGASGLVAAALIAVCIGANGFSSGPTYSGIADGFCLRLGYAGLEPVLGRFEDDVEEATPIDADKEGIACKVSFADTPVSVLQIRVEVHPSESDARDRFSSFAAANSRNDLWDLDLPVQDAQWGYNQFRANAAVRDGNLFVSLTLAGHFDIDEIDVHFGEPLGVFLRTALDNVEKA